MNILFTTHQGDTAGATYSIAYLAKGLAAKGHRVYVAARAESLLFSLLKDSGVHLRAMVFKSKKDVKAIRQLRDLILSEKIELVNAQDSRDRYLTIFAKWWYQLNVKIVHTRRQRPKSVGGWLHNMFYVRGTDRIIVISDELKNIFVDRGFPESHLYVIYNGTPREQYANIQSERVEELRKKYGLQPNDTVIGCVARMKEQPQLIESLQYIDDDIKVVFAGIPAGSLDKYVAQFNIKNPIIYTGTLDRKDTLHLYKLLNVNVLPSTMDGFGLVLVEAMALEVPVVATNFGGIKNVISHGVDGLLFEDNNIEELAEQIRKALFNTSVREKLIKNGQITALEKFSVEKTVQNHEAFFQSLIDA